MIAVTPETTRSFDDLKRSRAVLELYRVRLKLWSKEGTEYRAQCVFHRDKNPSLTFFKDDDGCYRHKCFSCGASGDIFDFLQITDKLNKPQALKLVSDFVASEPDASEDLPASKPELTPEERIEAKQNAERLHQQLEELFFFDDNDPGAIALLQHRGISDSVRKQALLGFEASVKGLGCVPAISFPVFWKNEVIGLRFRAINPVDKSRKWIQVPGSKSDLLYGAEWPAVNDSGVVVIFEGNLDTLLARSLGENGVGYLGVSAVPSKNASERFLESAELVKKLAPNGVLIVGDSDQPGEDAKDRLSVYFPDATTTAVPAPFKDFSEYWMQKPDEAAEWLRIERQRAARTPCEGDDCRETVPLQRCDDFEFPDQALHGLAGGIVRKLMPETEAHPAGMLLDLLARFGNVIGRTAYYQVEGDKHFANLFVVRVGATAKARKGTSQGRINQVFEGVDDAWTANRIFSQLGSGEGVIHNVRDEQIGDDGKVTDPGVKDKRFFCYEGEFGGLLTVKKRDGNSLSAILRNAWDGKPLAITVRNNPARASNPHVSVVADVTADELKLRLDATDSYDGFANRFLWVHVERTQLKPFGGIDLDWTAEREQLRDAIAFAKKQKRIFMREAARKMWDRVYQKLSASQPGPVGAILSRSEAQVLRLALLFALLDKSDHIESCHLRSALAVFDYCAESVHRIFGTGLQPGHKALLDAMAEGPKAVSWFRETTFKRNRPVSDVERMLQELEGKGLAQPVQNPETGVTKWRSLDA